MALEVLGDRKGIVHVSLNAQAQRFETLKEQERAEGVQSGAKVAENDDSDVDGIRDRLERVPEPEAVVTLGRLSELGELARSSPIELYKRYFSWGEGGTTAEEKRNQETHFQNRRQRQQSWCHGHRSTW